MAANDTLLIVAGICSKIARSDFLTTRRFNRKNFVVTRRTYTWLRSYGMGWNLATGLTNPRIRTPVTFRGCEGIVIVVGLTIAVAGSSVLIAVLNSFLSVVGRRKGKSCHVLGPCSSSLQWRCSRLPRTQVRGRRRYRAELAVRTGTSLFLVKIAIQQAGGRRFEPFQNSITTARATLCAACTSPSPALNAT